MIRYQAAQVQLTVAALTGPWKVRVTTFSQKFGRVICTCSVWPGGIVEAAGVNVTPLSPLLLPVQFKATALDELVSVTVQVHWFASWHCGSWSAKMLVGVTEICGAACTVSVTGIDTALMPMLIVTVSL